MSHTLVVAAHPQLQHSRITRTLLQQARSAALPGVTINDLYARYPDYHIDIAAEQRALAAARNLVWLHPIHWYSMPPLLKLWLDEVFAFGWAYGPGGDALAGKRFWLVTSTGGGPESYREEGHHGHAFADFLLPCVQTARLTRMCLLEPLVLHAAHRIDEAALAAHAAAFMAGLVKLARDEADAAVMPGAAPVPRHERPPA